MGRLQTAPRAKLCTCARTGVQNWQSIRSITRPRCCHIHLTAQPIIYCRLILVSRGVGTCTLACFAVIKGRRLKSGGSRAADRGQKSTRAEKYPLILLGEAGGKLQLEFQQKEKEKTEKKKNVFDGCERRWMRPEYKGWSLTKRTGCSRLDWNTLVWATLC